MEGSARTIAVFVNALAHRHGRDIDWLKVPPEQELSAAEVAMKLDYSGYTKLVMDAMRPWQKDKASRMHWPDRFGRA